MRVVLASDHRGFEMKEEIKRWLISKNFEVVDMGCDSKDSVDYPDFSIPASKKVSKGEVDFGILFCSTGEGMVISANKVKRIRAALIYKPEIARFAKEHNGANVLCFPADYISVEDVKKSIEEWLNAQIKEERHIRRIKKIEEYENEFRV